MTATLKVREVIVFSWGVIIEIEGATILRTMDLFKRDCEHSNLDPVVFQVANFDGTISGDMTYCPKGTKAGEFNESSPKVQRGLAKVGDPYFYASNTYKIDGLLTITPSKAFVDHLKHLKEKRRP